MFFSDIIYLWRENILVSRISVFDRDYILSILYKHFKPLVYSRSELIILLRNSWWKVMIGEHEPEYIIYINDFISFFELSIKIRFWMLFEEQLVTLFFYIIYTLSQKNVCTQKKLKQNHKICLEYNLIKILMSTRQG